MAQIDQMVSAFRSGLTGIIEDTGEAPKSELAKDEWFTVYPSATGARQRDQAEADRSPRASEGHVAPDGAGRQPRACALRGAARRKWRAASHVAHHLVPGRGA